MFFFRFELIFNKYFFYLIQTSNSITITTTITKKLKNKKNAINFLDLKYLCILKMDLI